MAADARHVGRHGVHLDLMAACQHGHPEVSRHGRHLAGACLGLGMPSLRAGQKVPDTGGIAPSPPPPALLTGGPSAPSAPSPVCAGGFAGAPAALCAVPKSRSRVFTPGDQAVPLLGDLRQPRLGGPPVVTGPGQAGLEVRAPPTPPPAAADAAAPFTPPPPPSAHALPPAPPALPGWPYAGLSWEGGGGIGVPLGGGEPGLSASGPRGWGGVVLPLNVNGVSPPLPLPPHMDAYGMGCRVLGRCAEPLVRTQFPEHPPSLNFGANHLKKWIRHQHQGH